MIIAVNRDVRVETNDTRVTLKICPFDQCGKDAVPAVIEMRWETAERLRSALNSFFKMEANE